MASLTSNLFREKMGVELSHINFDYEAVNINGSAYNFIANEAQKPTMIGRIKAKWTTGVNVFSKTAIDEAIAAGTTPYKISYTVTFGDTKTRNGVLQLLSGQILFTSREEGGGTVYGLDANADTPGALQHSSYTVDMNLSNLSFTVNGDDIKINNN